MKEGRATKYGRNLGRLVNYTIKRSVYESQIEDYRQKFLKELNKYSFEPRKKGDPKNKGCVNELEKISDVDVLDPVQFAKLVKEGIHLTYLKSTSKRIFKGLLEETSKPF